MWKIVLLALVLASACALAPPPEARGDAFGPRPAFKVAAEPLVPLEKVYGTLRKHYSGEPLDAKILRQGPGLVLYEIQWLTDDGRKLIFTVNARDGGIVATRGVR